MKETSYLPRPFDEKNLTTEWIEEVFAEKGWLSTPRNEGQFGGELYSYITYLAGTLVEISWRLNENVLSVHVIPDVAGSAHFLLEKRAAAISEALCRMEQFENNTNMCEDKENMIHVEYNVSNDSLLFFFYWEKTD